MANIEFKSDFDGRSHYDLNDYSPGKFDGVIDSGAPSPDRGRSEFLLCASTLSKPPSKNHQLDISSKAEPVLKLFGFHPLSLKLWLRLYSSFHWLRFKLWSPRFKLSSFTIKHFNWLSLVRISMITEPSKPTSKPGLLSTCAGPFKLLSAGLKETFTEYKLAKFVALKWTN